MRSPAMDGAQIAPSSVSHNFAASSRNMGEDHMNSAVEKTMGRIYLAPIDQQPDKGTEFWVNIGESREDLRKVPAFEPLLQSACTQGQYDKMMSALTKESSDTKLTLDGEFGCCVTGLCIVGALALPPVALGFFFVGRHQTAQLHKRLAAIVEAEQKQFFGSARYEHCTGTVGGGLSTEMALDQNGNHLTGRFGGQGGVVRLDEFTHDAWPPLGINIVLTLPGKSSRGAWMDQGTQVGARAPIRRQCV